MSSATGLPSYRLRPASTQGAGPVALDEHQQAVVDHAGGPLLVLAGPGTGKTTTLVEAIVDRIERRGTPPDRVLALTFSRKAAEQLRDRVTARLGRTLSTTTCATFHSFAYGLVREFAPPELYADPLRLLTAPEQDVVVQELLAGDRHRWPESFAAAVGTRGFAHEVAGLLSRAQEKGIGYDRLRAIGEAAARDDLVAAAAFMAEYDDVLAGQNLLDYAGLIAAAVALLQDPAQPAREALRARFDHVFVDEYQDTDPSQVALLRAFAGDGRDLTVVGDPHQSIYGFRGADVRGILDFPTAFPRADGSPADVRVLRTTRRFGGRVLTASQRVAARIGLPGSIGTEERQAFLAPRTEPGREDHGSVEVLTFDTERAETEHLADLLRRAHLEDGVAWSQMAVLVRSGRTSIPGLRRALAAAGVPVEVAVDDTPLAQEPAVLPLLDALSAVVDPDGWLDTDRARALLVSPLAGLDAGDVRTLARALRARERAADGPGRPSPELLREALRDPAVLDGLPGRAAGQARALAQLLQGARARLDAGDTAEEVLWELWAGTSWPERLRATAVRGGAASRLAHRDLDAVCALFETAARAEEQRGHTSVASFLETLRAQQIPADTLAERGIRREAVRLLTAHRAKGLEWQLVVAAHVQEERWPDLRRRSSLLRADELGHGGLQPPTTSRELLAEERRLFYVACTRARERLVVTAVRSPDDDGEQPSRFLAELVAHADDIRHRQGRPPRPLSLAGLVAELRRTTADPEAPAQLRAAAARRLARLAAERDGDRRLVPLADPGAWWGTRAASTAPTPVRPPDEPVRLTASALTGLDLCPAQWFWAREAGGERASTQSQGFGNVVHALADRIGRGELRDDPDVLEELMAHVDRVWAEIPFRTPWSGERERQEARNALARFLAWHQRPDARTLVATEQSLRAEVRLPDGSAVVVDGRADRLELDADGRVVVVDLKTGKYPPTDKELPDNPQLGLYQLAVEHGAADALLPDDAARDPETGSGLSGGAELWQLRKQAYGRLKVQAQRPQEPGDDGLRPVERQLGDAVAVVRRESFPARPGTHCDRCDFARMCPALNAGTVIS